MCAQYNAVRLVFTVIIALIFGSVFWGLGHRRWGLVYRIPWLECLHAGAFH